MSVQYWPTPKGERPLKLTDVAEQVTETQTALTEVYEGQCASDAQITETQLALAEVYEGQIDLAAQILELQVALAEIYEGGLAE